MKLKHTLSLLSLATCAALSTSAFAQQTVTFKGTITDSVCTSVVAGNSGTVTLPHQSLGDFAGLNTYPTNVHSFNVVLNGCQPAAATYRVNFSDSTVNANGDLPNATGNSIGFGFRLFNEADTNQIKFTTAASSTTGPYDPNDPGVLSTTGSATLPYKVRYIQLGALPASGTVESTATMTVQYQ